MTHEQALSQFVIRANEEDLELTEVKGKMDAKVRQRLQDDARQVP